MSRALILIMITAFMLSACYEPVTKQPQENATVEINETVEVVEDPVEEVEPEPVKTGELPDRNFTLSELQRRIMDVTGEAANFAKAEGTPVVQELVDKGEYLVRDNPSPLAKNWVIHVLEEEKIEDMQDLYRKVSSPGWTVWRYYINETEWGWLHEPLTEAELESLLPNYPYKRKYLKESDLIYVNTEEEPVETSKGEILRFSMLSMVVNQFDYWQEDWEKPLLVYKIPCTKDTIVYMKPEWSLNFGSMQFLNQKKDTVVSNWNNKISSIEQEMLGRAENIMEFCGIEDHMYEDADFGDYSDDRELYHNWRLYHRTDYDHDFSASVEFKKERIHDLYRIESIDIDFLDEDDSPKLGDSYRSLYLRVTIDDSGEEIDYIDQFLKSNYMRGERLEMEIEKDVDVTFGPDSEVVLWIYKGDSEMTDQHRYYIGDPVRISLDTSIVS